MEIKKHLKIMLAKSLFGPNRLLFFADTTPAATTAPEELESNYNAASELISIISSTDGFEGMDKNILLDPKKNPFYFKLLELGARFKSTDGALDFLLPVKKDGKVTLKYAATDPSVIEGEEYVALFWQEIQPEMHRALSKVPGTPDFKTSLIAELVNAGNPAMMEFAIAISKNGGDVDSDTTGRFLTAINTLPKVKALVVATSKHEKSSDYVNDKIADDKYELGQEIEKRSQDRLKAMLANLSSWKISVKRRLYERGTENEIDARSWSFNDAAGLERIKQDWITLGIYKGKGNKDKDKDGTMGFYSDDIFGELSKAHNDKFLNGLGKAKYFYMNATNKDLDIARNTDPVFASAVSYFTSIQRIVVAQDKLQVATTVNAKKGDRDPIFDEGYRIVKTNVKAFQKALRSKDYATAAVYVAGLYAMYKLYQGMDKKKQGILNKMMLFGAVALAGDRFAKAAGYNILRELGFTSPGSGVKGTALEIFYDLDIPGVDYGKYDETVLRDLAFVNLKDLNSLYESANTDGIHKIDSKRFRSHFKGRDLKDPKIKDKLDQQIYLFASAFRQAYNEKLRPRSNKENFSFAEAIDTGVLADSTVFDFLVGLYGFSSEKKDKDMVSAKLGQKSFNGLGKLVEDHGKELGFDMEVAEIEKGTGKFYGNIMDFPIVIKVDNDAGEYIVYGRDIYEKNPGGVHRTDAMAKIPFKGGSPDNEFEKIRTAVRRRMTSMVSIFKKPKVAGKMNLDTTTLDFIGGTWQLKLSRGESMTRKGSTDSIYVKIRVRDNGSSFDIINPHDRDAIIAHFEDYANSAKLEGNLTLSALTSQKGVGGSTDFTLLRHFSSANKLKYVDNDDKDHFFGIVIGHTRVGGKRVIQVKFDPDTGTYSFADSGVEAILLKNSSFQTQLTESITKSPAVVKLISQFNNIIDKTPQEYFTHLFKSIKGWFTEATWDYWFRGVDLKDFTGSISGNYVKALFASKIGLVSSKINVAFKNTSSLSEASQNVDDIFGSILNDLNGVKSGLANINTKAWKKGDKLSETEFKESVLDKLMGVGIKSENYETWYKSFANSVYLKYGMDDLRAEDAITANKLISIFGHYTAIVDTPELDGVATNLAFTDEMNNKMDELKLAHEKLEAAGKVPFNDTNLLTECASINTTGDLAVVKDNYVKRDLMNKQNKRLNYVTMVGDTIFEKLQSETWSLPPGPGPSWGIKTFEEYKNKDIVGPRLSTGVSIGREKPPMQTKYTAFHTYLNGPNQENTRLDNVVLPMDSRTFYFKKKDRELYRHMMVELYGADTADKTRIVSQGKEDFPYNPEMMPEAHKEFYNRVQIALNKLEEEYRDKFVPGGRRKWRTFRAKQAVPMASSNTTKLNKGTLQEIKSVKFSIKNNSFHNHLVKLDTAFKGKGPLGRSDQNQLIDLQVMEFLEANILTPYYFNNYFEDTSVPTLFRDAYAKIKGFLFGY